MLSLMNEVNPFIKKLVYNFLFINEPNLSHNFLDLFNKQAEPKPKKKNHEWAHEQWSLSCT